MAGLHKPYPGQVEVTGSVGMLPQNPQALFVKKTVREDLFEILKGGKLSREERETDVARAALAKVLLLGPDVLLLDEPTKGLDAEFKQVFAEILQVLLRGGVTILMVSHDIEFCAKYAHRCAMFLTAAL